MIGQRIFGIETEYGCQLGSETTDDATTILLDSAPEFQINTFLENGGRLYEDLGHPEYTTPECTTPFECGLYHHAGDVLMCRLRKNAYIADRTIRVYRDNLDACFNSYGCHENYMMRRMDRNSFRSTMLPFLTSRILLFGSGATRTDGSYVLSQRALVTTCVDSKTDATENNRSILNWRDESHLPKYLEENHCRFHVVCGDTNVNQALTVLKVGVTGLIITLLENDWGYSALCPANPLTALSIINRDITGKAKVQVVGLRRQSAYDIQRRLCDLAGQFVEFKQSRNEIAPWLVTAHQDWMVMLDDLARCDLDDYSHRGPLPDWKIKLFLLRHLPKTASFEKRLAVGMEYHNTQPEESLAHYLVKKSSLIRPIFTEEALRHSISTPSNFRRALERGSVVSNILRGIGNYDGVSWVGYTRNKKFYEFPFSFT